jgi:hypothetical protein
MSSKYVDNVDKYKFSDRDKNNPFLDKIDVIEKERMEFIKEVLGFEKYLFDNSVIDRKNFTDTATHISFKKICDELIKKRWDGTKLTELNEARNNALHGEIPEGTSFTEAKMLTIGLKK